MGKNEIQKFVEDNAEKGLGLMEQNNYILKAKKIVVHEGEQLNIPVMLQVFTDKNTGAVLLMREV